MSLTETGLRIGPGGTHQRPLPLEISARCTLVTLEMVRSHRGCDAESVLAAVADATHPRCLRWVFDLSVIVPCNRRELRFWRDEVFGQADRWGRPAEVIGKILGDRPTFPRGEIEIAWNINATTLSRLVRLRELSEVNRKLTRSSLAQFLERRLQ
ncbi:MAG: hypothetical protein KGL39_47745 [Patescibacteria group bacterium]|nr:hypothetical protein [Patescibacteria group bacterium]